MAENNFADLQLLLDQCMIRDRFRLGKELHARRKRNQVEKKIHASVALAERRHDLIPKVSYPEQLPVSARRDEIKALLRDNQVIVVAGETGSGKTTQLPKICLELGRGVLGRIGHTQPRRVAARTVASRVAEELGVELGRQVGYQVRFADNSGDDTLVKVMTDGILLAETQHDRFLEAYDTLIIDEAHERSLNIDFLLGYLRRILPKRPDLKIIITSATIDLERFSRHFNNAPIIEVSGRTYPVDVWYRPLSDDANDDGGDAMYTGILDALREIRQNGPGDVLVFLSGEREIRETAQLIRKAGLPGAEVLPLYSRLTVAEQDRVFAPHQGWRIVLATNVAETSLTVPGIRYVIDPGLARISRYSVRSKVQQLPIEKISRASADQRKGRCGRVAAGICVRLYDEEDFASRPAFTSPEILRTNLAAVILQMQSLKLGDIAKFPFVERPEQRQINDGYQLLLELGAVDDKRQLTRMGRDMARYPVDLRFARMLIEAGRQGSLTEVLVIASGLTVQDPRERPHDRQQQADEAHQRFHHEQSDFMALVNLWHEFETRRQELTRGQLRRYCKQNFLSEARLREWRELHRQLRLACRDNGLKENREAAEYDAIHRSLLAGLLGHIGNRDGDHEYRGAHGRKHFIFPGSGQFKRRPPWIASGELTETTRLYARNVAQIDNAWIEPLAAHLLRRKVFDPFYDDKRRQVLAYEQVTLYGLVLVNRREVDYAAWDPEDARAMFIQAALVDRRLRSKAGFYKHNNQLIRELEQLESKARKRDILVESRVLFEFYDRTLPRDITCGIDLDNYLAGEGGRSRKLYMDREMLQKEQVELSRELYPDEVKVADVSLPLNYRFEPGNDGDGVSLKLPLAILRQVDPAQLDYAVPGLLEEKCLALIKSLPKRLRKQFIPAPDYASRAAESLAYDGRPLTETLAEKLFRMTGERISAADFQASMLEKHLAVRIQVTDEKGKVLGSARDLNTLVTEFGDTAPALKPAGQDLARSGIKAWDFGDLPDQVEVKHGNVKVRGYPALVDQEASVAIEVFDNAPAADAAHAGGVLRLLLLRLADQRRYIARNIPGFDQAALYNVTQGSRDELLVEVVTAVFRFTLIEDKTLPRTQAAFDALIDERGRLAEVAVEVGGVLLESFQLAHEIRARLPEVANARNDDSIEDISRQLSRLLGPGYLASVPLHWFRQYPRYLKALAYRLDKLAANVTRDQMQMAEVIDFEKRLADLGEQVEPNHLQYRWMIEEFRVSQFAQRLGTSIPVSAKRLEKTWAQEVGSIPRS